MSFSSRREFLRQLLGAGALAATGLDTLSAQPTTPGFRFAFLTDLHLMKDGALRSAEGIAACLGAVEKLDPRPDFILVGGDLVHRARDLTVTEAKDRLTLFQKIWADHTALPAHWTFGNHDLVGTSNLAVPASDPDYAKGLFMHRFKLPHLFYSFDHQGWHIIVLDDIDPLPDQTYIGKLFDDELAFLRADLDAHRHVPTIVCTHIPIVSNLAYLLNMSPPPPGTRTNGLKSLVCTNGSEVTSELPNHNIRAVLCGHLHHFEKMQLSGVSLINSGAVCGNYWKGPVMDSPEGFGVVDLGADGAFNFDYHTYGWNAAKT